MLTGEPENMTQETLDGIIAALPKELSEAEISALTVTLYNSYGVDAVDAITSLIVVIYIIGETNGLAKSFISAGLRRAADREDAHVRATH